MGGRPVRAFPSYRLPAVERSFRQWMWELTGLDGDDLDEWIATNAQHALADTERIADRHRTVLTPRELDVLLLMAMGHTRFTAAQRLRVEPETIKSTLRNALRKTECRNTTHLVVWAIAAGVLLDHDG